MPQSFQVQARPGDSIFTMFSPFQSFLLQVKHYGLVHRLTAAQVPMRWPCKLCPKVFKNDYYLRKHKEVDHLGKKGTKGGKTGEIVDGKSDKTDEAEREDNADETDEAEREVNAVEKAGKGKHRGAQSGGRGAGKSSRGTGKRGGPGFI